MVVSKGLRAHLKDIPTSDLATNEVEADEASEPRRGFVLSVEQWAALRANPIARRNLLALLERGEPERARSLLDSLAGVDGAA